ncbi:MAG TPA: hypothetical protein PLN69_10515 [bacterium]|nr:hypothetical protein [bacterium]
MNVLKAGLISSWTTCLLLIIYIPVTIIGILSIETPADPIHDPYFSIMELLIILIAPLLTVNTVVIYLNSKNSDKVYGMISMILMSILTVITSSVHFVVLTASRTIEQLGLENASLFFSFEWPSVAYALDILAWDWFFALSMIMGAFTFNATKQERLLRAIMIISGVISLSGLAGVPLSNMNIRNIGIIGYTIIAAIAFFIMGTVYKKQMKI